MSRLFEATLRFCQFCFSALGTGLRCPSLESLLHACGDAFSSMLRLPEMVGQENVAKIDSVNINGDVPLVRSDVAEDLPGSRSLRRMHSRGFSPGRRPDPPGPSDSAKLSVSSTYRARNPWALVVPAFLPNTGY
jgi:hypothetical protein